MTDQEKILANAQLVIDQFRAKSELGDKFGFDSDSVRCVENFIENLRKVPDLTSEKLDHYSQVFGSYLGECVIKEYGGTWKLNGDGWGVFFDEGNAVYPFSKVRKQLQNGAPEGDSILGFFQTIGPVFFNRT